jgi:hypothetical protein
MAATMATTSAFTGTSLSVQTRRFDPFPMQASCPASTAARPETCPFSFRSAFIAIVYAAVAGPPACGVSHERLSWFLERDSEFSVHVLAPGHPQCLLVSSSL